jgi:RNA polymerase sigma factor (sigma-70 family)
MTWCKTRSNELGRVRVSGSDLRGWLFSIMHNLNIDRLRRPGLSVRTLDDSDLELPTRATQSDRLDVMDLQSALTHLPDEQRQVLLLIALEEMSYVEVSQTLGIPIGTVMSRLSRGRERLRRVLEGHIPASPNLRVVK